MYKSSVHRLLGNVTMGRDAPAMVCVHINSVLGARVRQLRHSAGFTQAVLSQRSGLFRTHLSRIECGTANPTLAAIVSIAYALGVSPMVLLREAALSQSGPQ